MEEESANHSSIPEEPDNNPSATLLSDKLQNEESVTEIRGMEDLVDENSSLSELQLVHRKSTAKKLSNIVSEWGKKVY